MTWAAIDVRRLPWIYRPERHKTGHLGCDRVIPLGPRARVELASGPGQLSGAVFRSRRSPHGAYSTASYRQAVVRACDRAGVVRWCPLQLRHAAATRLREELGVEVARAVLGHRRLSTTELYTDVDTGRAIAAMQQLG
jgi:integrase